MTTILIADDRPVNRQVLVTLLEYCRIRVIEACNGDEALKLIKSERPDAAILDFVMPGLGGIEVAKHVRSDSVLRGMGLILHSAAYKIHEAEASAEELGMLVLQKPAQPTELWDAVEKVLKIPIHRPPTNGALSTSTKKTNESRDPTDPREFSARLASMLELSFDVYSQIPSMDSATRVLEMFGVGARPLLNAELAGLVLLDDSSDIAQKYLVFRGTHAEALDATDGYYGQDMIKQFRQLPNRPSCEITLQATDLFGLLPDHPALNSFLSVPLITAGKTIGWLYFVNKCEADEFAEIDKRVAGALGEQLVICYENALLHERLRDRAAELENELAERRRVEEALRQRSDELYQLQKLETIGQLAGGIAHEFNNTLQVIQGYTQFAVDTLDESEPIYHDLQVVLKASGSAATLVSQLLDFARRTPMQFASIDPNQWIDSFVKMVRPLIGDNIEIDSTLDASRAAIKGDSAMLQQVLLNLCLNARDAMPRGGQLHIAVEAIKRDENCCSFEELGCHDGVRIIVADTGTGIEPDALAHLFEPFFTTKDVGEGTGLGLATAYGIVKQHGGTIQVDSEVGAGTEFSIFLPAEVYEPKVASQDKCVGGCSGKAEVDVEVAETVLVVDDDPKVRRLAEQILTKAGYKTVSANDGMEAVQVFRQQADVIALAILDVVMPRMSGYAVCEELRSLNPDVKIVFCTGYDPDSIEHPTTSSMDYPLITKPYSQDTILKVVREALSQRETLLCEAASLEIDTAHIEELSTMSNPV